MTKGKIALAILCAVGFVCLVLLLLNVHPLPAVFIFPGYLLAAPFAMLIKPEEFGSLLLIVAANVLIYFGVVYIALSWLGRRLTLERVRQAIAILLLPTAILVILACIPKLNPLWPHSMAELARRETALQQALSRGIRPEQARSILRSQGIQFQEWTETSKETVLERYNTTIHVAPGDRFIWARIETDAGQFPCGYDIEVFLHFGPDEKLKDSYVHRRPICL
jgi:hypothetical protein